MNITTFDFNGTAVRTVEENSEMLWVAKDVCDCLGLTNIGEAISTLDEEDLTSVVLMSGGQTREMKAVTEAGLYQLIFKSRKEAAKAFKKWVTHEVLPTIRKTGSYSKGFFTEQDDDFEFEAVDAVEAKKYYDAEGREIPDPKDHRYKLPETISPSWIKCIVELYGKRIAENYFATHLGVPQEVLALPKVEFVAVIPEMKEFVDECIFKSVEEQVSVSALYEAYRQWGGGMSKNNFGKEFQKYTRIESKVYHINGQSVRCYDGVAIKGV